MYVVVVNWTVKQEHAEEAAKLLHQQAANSLRLEPQCQRFDVARIAGNQAADNVFLLYEIYNDEAAFKAHLTTEHYKAFDPVMKPLTLDKQVSFWNLMGHAAK